MPRLKNILPGLLIAVLSFWGGFEFFLRAYPYYKVNETFKFMTNGTFERYHWFYIPRLSGASKGIRRVSGDILYGYCLFDLEEGDVEIKVPAWNQFQSASVFSMNSDHYLSERSLDGKALNFKITKKSVPFSRGFIMLRRLATNSKSHIKNLECKKL